MKEHIIELAVTYLVAIVEFTMIYGVKRYKKIEKQVVQCLLRIVNGFKLKRKNNL